MINSYSIQKLYVLLLFFILPITLSAQKRASTPHEKELVEAVTNNFTTLAQHLLIEENLDANLTDLNEQSLLMLAARKNNNELVTLLLKKGADVNYRIGSKRSLDRDGNAIARLMLDGRTVLDYAISSGSIEMTEFLIKSGAKLDIKNQGLNSTVANASQANNVKMVRYLLSKGAKVSPETGRRLVAWHIITKADPFYGWKKIDKNTDFSLVKIWDDYGISIDDDDLLKLSLFRTEKDRSELRRYMTAYREWLAKGAEVVVKDEKRHAVAQIAARTMHESEMDSIFAESVQRADEEQKIQNAITLRETGTLYNRIFIAIIISLILAGSYFGSKRFRSSLSRFFSTRYTAPPPPPVVSAYRKNVIPFRRPRSRNQSDSDSPTELYRRRKGKFKKSDKLDLTVKGWTVDDTLHIEVLYLTVEDMINPISLCNEHEKAVREMIAYIRTLERCSDNEIADLIGKDTLASKLEALWKSIDPANVRSIYKRSLYLLVENYSQRDKRVNTFLEKIKY